MPRALRLLLVAALVAGPVAARPPAAHGALRTWAVTGPANPAASTLTAVVEAPPLAALESGTGRTAATAAWSGGDGGARRVRLRHVDRDPHRPRVVRRHRPAPRSTDGEPPH